MPGRGSFRHKIEVRPRSPRAACPELVRFRDVNAAALATDDRLRLEVARRAGFGQLYLRDGVTENGRHILSAGGRSILNCMARREGEGIVGADAYQAMS